MLRSSMTLLLLTVWVVLSGCQSGSGFGGVAAPAEPSATVLMADQTYKLNDADLEQRGLEKVWNAQLRVKTNEKMIDAYLLGDHIILESASKRLYGINRKSGVPTLGVDLPYRCDFRGCDDDTHVYVPCRNILVAIDKRGFVAYRKFLKFAPGGIPVSDPEHVFIPCFDGRMRSFLKQSGYFDRQYTTEGELEAKPGLGTRYVYAGSNDGVLYALSTDRLERAWMYKTFGPIRAGIVHDGRQVFVASTDGSLYALNDMPQDTREAQLDWHRPYASGDSIDKTPFVAKDLVCVINRRRECHAVDRKTGNRRWLVPNVDEVLTQGKINTYLLRGNSRILAADNKTGVIRWSLDTRPGIYSFFLVNAVDDTLYMVKQNGEVQAIRERRPPKPTPPPIPVPTPPTS